MEFSQIDLYEFLTESELQHYYNAIKNELKITSAAQLKYASDEDLWHIGLSRPEIRRLRKFYEKHFPHGYFSKLKRLLQTPTIIVKRDDANSTISQLSVQHHDSETTASTKDVNSPSKVPNNKHIIPADSITVNKQLGTGEFGIVQQGVWTNGNERIQVAIKCLCRERMQSNPMEFLKEAAIMHSIEHENIVRLYGVVLATDSLMLVTELAHLRSLLECLKDSGLRVSFLTIPTLCEFSMQICNGMRYLENKRLIHRDLAARNILVFSKNKVKISDFGLSRALGVGKDYYKTNFNVNLKLPIAWCAPECINYLRFTNASDVWAYGVCLWEMFSYGFQPWAALTGLQILEAIDAPNYQRLEQPDCCPREYYSLMVKCWQDDATKRPKFDDIYEMLPDMKPEQLKTVVHCLEPKKDHLLYYQGDIITVLDRNTGTPFWKGVLVSGKTGFFNPSNTVAFLEGLPSSNRESFSRTSERCSKRKLKTEMISKPQNDLKHTGHVGIDGASFGDIAFLGNSQSYNHVPRQIVTPYKPSEDIEQTPLLLPATPTSPDSLQTASGYFPEGANTTPMNLSFIPSIENTPKHFSIAGKSSFEFPGQQSKMLPGVTNFTNPFGKKTDDDSFALQNNTYGIESKSFTNKYPSLLSETGTIISERSCGGAAAAKNNGDEWHEYHEISDDEITADKLDFGPSLLDEINSMFGSISASNSHSKSPDFDQANIKNEFTEFTSKLVQKNGADDSNMFAVSTSKKKSAGIVKQISIKDEKILNQAIEIAHEISARSMNDLVSDQPCNTQSPKRKFSFRFPHLSSNGSNENCMTSSSPSAGGTGNNSQLKCASPHSKKKNFTEELQSIPDIQSIIGVEGREAYNSLIERKTRVGLSPAVKLFVHLDTNEFEIATAKTLPRSSTYFRNGVEILETYRSEKSDQLVSPPLQNTLQPMTLPTRGAARRVKKIDLSKSNNAKEFGDKMIVQHDDNQRWVSCDGTAVSPCESPSYMSNTFYKFPENPQQQLKVSVLAAGTNPVPLPTRESKKHIQANPKRHVRKHPLIIPGSGVQRTLNKVTEASSTYDEATNNALSSDSLCQKTFEVVESVRANPRLLQQPYENALSKNVSHTYQNVEKKPAYETCITDDSASLHFESIMEADFNKCNVLQSPGVTDGFYNFLIEKEHYNKSKEVEIAGLYVNEDECRNLDVEKSLKTHNTSNNTLSSISPSMETGSTSTTEIRNTFKESSEDHSPCDEFVPMRDKTKIITNAENELVSNALFQRVRESVDIAMLDKSTANVKITSKAAQTQLTHKSQSSKQQTEAEYFAVKAAQLANSNSVSCEDLLEFSDKKPRGCERGVDSDEVRIMMKVLGKDSIVPMRCLTALEFINWDVHKAIKIIKLQNILPSANLNMFESVDALQQHEWDLHFTALELKGRTTLH